VSFHFFKIIFCTTGLVVTAIYGVCHKDHHRTTHLFLFIHPGQPITGWTDRRPRKSQVFNKDTCVTPKLQPPVPCLASPAAVVLAHNNEKKIGSRLGYRPKDSSQPTTTSNEFAPPMRNVCCVPVRGSLARQRQTGQITHGVMRPSIGCLSVCLCVWNRSGSRPGLIESPIIHPSSHHLSFPITTPQQDRFQLPKWHRS
jgi:hypothetical protein